MKIHYLKQDFLLGDSRMSPVSGLEKYSPASTDLAAPPKGVPQRGFPPLPMEGGSLRG